MIVRQAFARGRVQGVGYRAFVQRQAAALSLTGWVRNRRDGSVELVVAGAGEGVEALLAACRNGPLGARVDELEIYEAQMPALSAGAAGVFSILPTA